MPSRRLIRSWLAHLPTQNTAYALALVVLDIALFCAALAATIAIRIPALQGIAGAATGFMIGRLFILGHDACHQSLTRHRTFNRWVGRLLFLPSLTPYSLWDAGHNIVHHGFTNLKGVDVVWQPRSLAEYQALPRWRQRLERVYRSGWAPGLYYLVEIWWARMLFPSKRVMPTRRTVFVFDSVLASAATAGWLAGLIAAAYATHQSAWWLGTVGFVLPLVVWNAMIGFAVYVHHTHAGVTWYDDRVAWAESNAYVSSTVHLTFRSIIGSLAHHIMEHTAHHVDMSIPLYRLKKAQVILASRLAGRIVIQPFSWPWYARTARCCKLYDYQARCWTDFAGRPTTSAVST